MSAARPPRTPSPHDLDRLIAAGRALADLDLHREPMRAEFYRTTAVAVGLLLARLRETEPLRNVVSAAEPTQTVFENVAFDRDGDFRALAGEVAAREVATLARDLLARVARRGALS